MKMTPQDLEESIASFEDQFLSGSNPDILDFVGPDAIENSPLFNELLHTDLELRLRSGENARVEDYMTRFPSVASQSDMVEALLKTEFKVRSKFEPGLRIEEYNRRFPDLYQSLPTDSRYCDSTISPDPNKDFPSAAPTESCSDYSSRFRKRRLHQQGGLGNIWLANDRELNRTVAIKEIKEKFNGSSAHRIRFKREQIITSKLDHPGIVPIYGIGYFADGAPYYAMQFIDGLTLTDAVEKFHGDSTLSRVKRQLKFRRLLQHFIDACNTIDYAHSQSVVHRDIKPANIMIGQFGETYVVDWGLAKLGNESRETPAKMQADDITDEQNTTDGPNGTFSTAGQSIGSPGYMSPEQKSGNIEAITVQSDVYGLGATLWKIITNSPPNFNKHGFKGCTDPAVHQPLVSICARAMSAAPADRYPSAQALSEEVQRYLSNEIVDAHEYSFLDRVYRFTKNHNEMVTAASIAAMLLSAVLAVAAIWINHERATAIAARESESIALVESESLRAAEADARRRAEERTSQLTGTIQVFADIFGGSDDSGLFLLSNKTTLDEALDNLMLQVDEYDTPVQSLLYAIFARNNKGQGDYNRAIELYEKSLQLLKQDNIPISDALHLDVLIGLAFTKLYDGKPIEAMNLKQEIQEAVSLDPENLALQEFKLNLLGSRLSRHFKKPDESIAQINESIRIAKKLYADIPDHNNILWSKFRLASMHMYTGSYEEAGSIFEAIITTLKNKSERHPIGITSAVQLAVIDYVNNDLDGAIERCETAVADARNVMGDEHPDTTTIRIRHATFLALHPDPDQRNRGIQEIEECRAIQLDKFGLSNPNTMATSCLLAKVLLKIDDDTSTNRALQIAEDYFQDPSFEIIEAAKKHNVLTIQLATVYTRCAARAGNLDLALKRLTKTNEKINASELQSLIDRLIKESQEQE